MLNTIAEPLGAVCSSIFLTFSVRLWVHNVKTELGKMRRWKILTLCSCSVLQRDYNCKSNMPFCFAVKFGSVLDDLLQGMWNGHQVILSECEFFYLLYLSDSWEILNSRSCYLRSVPPPPSSLSSSSFIFSLSVFFISILLLYLQIDQRIEERNREWWKSARERVETRKWRKGRNRQREPR